MRAASNYVLYDQLFAVPQTLIGEILNGQLHTVPRPSTSHAHASSVLEDEILGPFPRERGGPGGRFADPARIAVAPFQTVTIALDELWLPHPQPGAR